MKQGVRVRRSLGDRIVDVIIYIVLGLIALSTVLPFLYVVAGSFATDKELTEKAFFIIPEVWSLNAYKYAINTANILRGLRNSIILTIAGTVMCMLFSLSFAYPLSKVHFRGRNWIMNMVIVTMLFSGGMIPNYLVFTAYGLYDSYWALILPGLISPFNMIIIKKFFADLPQELEDAAYVDGAGDLKIFARIALPLSKALIAVLTLMFAVGHWNSYFGALMYLRTQSKFPLQLVLRQILVMNSFDLSKMTAGMVENMIERQYLANLLKYSVIIVSSAPVMLMYPFIQKHFVKGIMIGSLKG